MVRSIIDIDVNDEKFRAFQALFERYRDGLKTLPEGWAAAGDATEAAGAAFLAVTAALEAHSTLMAKQTAELKVQEQIERQRQQAVNKQAQAEAEAGRRRKQAIEDTRRIARNVADTALSLAKWAAIDIGLGALTLWGFDQFVTGVGAQRRQAQGLGVTTGQRQALDVNFSRYFDTGSAMEAAANAQMDPSKAWIWAGMGLNPTGKDPAELSVEAAAAARRMLGGVPQQARLPFAQAHGFTELFSPDDLRRILAPGNDLAASARDYRRDVGLFGLGDKQSAAWQDFIVKMDEAGWRMKNKFVDVMTNPKTEADLGRLIDQFGDLADRVLGRVDMRAFGDAIVAFTDYIGSAKFKSDFKTFIDNIDYAANKMVSVARLLGLLPDAPAATVGGLPVPEISAAQFGGVAAAGLPPGTGGVGGWLVGHAALWGERRGEAWAQQHIAGPMSAFGSWVGHLVGRGNATTGLPTAGQAAHPLALIEGAYGLVPGILGALYARESASGRRAGYSGVGPHGGALGPFQFEAATAAQYGVGDRMSFVQSAEGAAAYMGRLLKMFHGDVREAVAAYNWGEGHVKRDVAAHGADWERFAPPETRAYVENVVARMQAAASTTTVHLTVHDHTSNGVAVQANAASR